MGSEWRWAPAVARGQRMVVAQGRHAGAACLEVKHQRDGQVAEAQRRGTGAFQGLAQGAPTLVSQREKEGRVGQGL